MQWAAIAVIIRYVEVSTTGWALAHNPFTHLAGAASPSQSAMICIKQTYNLVSSFSLSLVISISYLEGAIIGIGTGHGEEKMIQPLGYYLGEFLAIFNGGNISETPQEGGKLQFIQLLVEP